MTEKKINCIIFDCEGTLVDSERLCCEALVEVFNQFGAELSFDQIRNHFEGGKIADILIQTRTYAKIDADIDLLEKRYRVELDRLFQQRLLPMEGALELLNYLDQQGIEYCVASNAPKEKMVLILERCGLNTFFEGRIFSAFEANSWKPEPDLIRYCAMSMGFLVEECIYVDDSEKGVEAGVNAEVPTFQLAPLNPNARSKDSNVVVINSLLDLKIWLSERCGQKNEYAYN
ncbi:HAD family hydrolase [Vibrio aestuarianus]|uniref:HAD family hydrolase n=1 Tax=Vibrio aestuarianus TaxID=28171 RepID=A0ABM9FHK7_9VIBR|nr:HAD family hydrolase [Vibrio aestuarianus]MDE1214562.1 HAD family hydrolase [Vibrio aestuarianus]MDE1218737.1 HAD family hydrolase [Vibrio aestuarianus]MDE1224859.1 HAD family hydrolase [Vibrio aestuarianus]MDE1229054.1 HAD family hydrolase [Vibrio aestuarianus]MDE1258159.1 HAD family hydrolase [Vibrio aestuarianus]